MKGWRLDPECDRELNSWLEGGSAIPLLDRLVADGHHDEAATYARLALADPECMDRDRVEEIVERVASLPDGWTEAVLEFAAGPSVEAWERLMHFTPPDLFYQRIRYTISLLQRLGMDPDVLFQCATRLGTTPDAIGFAESGEVDPDVVAHRAVEVPGAAGLWLGLAAQAAFARGDTFGVVRYLRQAYEKARSSYPPDFAAFAIREKADSDLHDMLDKIGVPRFE
jgi:hypothetical protein